MPKGRAKDYSNTMLARIYALLETTVPHFIKRMIPEEWRVRAGYKVKVEMVQDIDELGVRPSINLPPGESEASIKQFLGQYYVKEDGSDSGRILYLEVALRRFLYTLDLVPDRKGKLLEIGSGPYYMTTLLQRHREYELTLTNYYGAAYGMNGFQTLVDQAGNETKLDFANVDVERQRLPYEDESFDVVLLCEVLEHFVNDPLHGLNEIWRVLKVGGTLILTTPNVACIEHIARLLAGHNIFDPYSGYGPNGRHNREYTVEEVEALLTHAGFAVESCFTADAHANRTNQYMHISQFRMQIRRREGKLGQYIFIRATRQPQRQKLKPAWLYKDYPAGEIAPVGGR